MKLPIKTRILEFAIKENKPFKAEELAEVLRVEYNGEKTTSLERVKDQLETFRRVNFLKAENIDLDENGELSLSYMITESGKQSAKYIPGHGNKLF